MGKAKGVSMFGKKPNKPQNRIDSLIGAGTRIEGNIGFAGGLRVDGEIQGNVIAAADQPATLVVSEHARIDGEIRVSHVGANSSHNQTGPGAPRELPPSPRRRSSDLFDLCGGAGKAIVFSGRPTAAPWMAPLHPPC